MQYLFNTKGFALYELEDFDCDHQGDGSHRPGQILLFPECVEPCLGYEVVCVSDAEEAASLAVQIGQRKRGMGIDYMLRTSNGAIEDAKARRKERLAKASAGTKKP